MSTTSIEKEVLVESASILAWADGRMIFIELTDGRIIGFPAGRFKILKNATDEQLKEVTIRFFQGRGKKTAYLISKNDKTGDRLVCFTL